MDHVTPGVERQVLMSTKTWPLALASEATADPVQSTCRGGEGPGLKGDGSRENRKTGTFWKLGTDNSPEGFAFSQGEQRNGTGAGEGM